MQNACCLTRSVKDSLEMKNFDPCNNTFCSEKGPKKGHFGLETAKTMENGILKATKFKIAKVKLHSANSFLPPPDCEEFSGNNLGPCKDTFWSEKGPKKRSFRRKTAKTIEKQCFEGKKIQNRKSKVTQCKVPVLSPGLRRILWRRPRWVRALTPFGRRKVQKTVILAEKQRKR